MHQTSMFCVLLGGQFELRHIIASWRTKDLWEEVLDDCRDRDIKARTLGVHTQMKKFHFFFGLSLGMLVLGHADLLSEAIQKKTLTASEAQCTAAMTVKTLSDSLLKNEEMFWKKLKCQTDGNHVSSPTSPRPCRAPLRLEDCIGGKAMPEYPERVDDHYRRIYFEALDLVSTAINDCFNQPNYGMYAECGELLLSAVNGKTLKQYSVRSLNFLNMHDFSVETLRLNLQTLAANYNEEMHSLNDIFKYFRGLGPGVELMREALKLV